MAPRGRTSLFSAWSSVSQAFRIEKRRQRRSMAALHPDAWDHGGLFLDSAMPTRRQWQGRIVKSIGRGCAKFLHQAILAFWKIHGVEGRPLV